MMRGAEVNETPRNPSTPPTSLVGSVQLQPTNVYIIRTCFPRDAGITDWEKEAHDQNVPGPRAQGKKYVCTFHHAGCAPGTLLHTTTLHRLTNSKGQRATSPRRPLARLCYAAASRMQNSDKTTLTPHSLLLRQSTRVFPLEYTTPTPSNPRSISISNGKLEHYNL